MTFLEKSLFDVTIQIREFAQSERIVIIRGRFAQDGGRKPTAMHAMSPVGQENGVPSSPLLRCNRTEPKQLK